MHWNPTSAVALQLVNCIFHSDIDECAAMTHNCSDGLICENIPGNYTCVCQEGYTGLFCETGMNMQCMQIHIFFALPVDERSHNLFKLMCKV